MSSRSARKSKRYWEQAVEERAKAHLEGRITGHVRITPSTILVRMRGLPDSLVGEVLGWLLAERLARHAQARDALRWLAGEYVRISARESTLWLCRRWRWARAIMGGSWLRWVPCGRRYLIRDDGSGTWLPAKMHTWLRRHRKHDWDNGGFYAMEQEDHPAAPLLMVRGT